MPISADLSIRVGTRNVQGGLDPRGFRAGRRSQRLAPSTDRIEWALESAAHHNVAVLALQELSLLQLAEIRRHPDWDVIPATADRVKYRYRIIDGRPRRIKVQLANAVAWRTDQLELVRSTQLAVYFSRDVVERFLMPKQLHFPLVVVRDPHTTKMIAVMSVNFPGGGTRPVLRAKVQCAEEIKRFYLSYRMEIVDFIVAGDTNSGGLLRGWHHVDHHVDVVSSPTLELTDKVLNREWKGQTISERPCLSGEVHL